MQENAKGKKPKKNDKPRLPSCQLPAPGGVTARGMRVVQDGNVMKLSWTRERDGEQINFTVTRDRFNQLRERAIGIVRQNQTCCTRQEEWKELIFASGQVRTEGGANIRASGMVEQQVVDGDVCHQLLRQKLAELLYAEQGNQARHLVAAVRCTGRCSTEARA